MESFSIASTTKDVIPKLPFAKLKEETLGKKYNCSLVFVGDKRSRALNIAYRNKDYIPNTLSFTLDENNGEIFINLKEAKKQCVKREESFEYYIALLFVHSCLHLKGMEHSDIMDSKMERILRRVGITNKF
jgi:rRNA maturation RNase YbeY